MRQIYTCYLHKPGVMTPELRVVSCEREQDLPDQILAELPTWGEFEKIDVYDVSDQPMFSFTAAPGAEH